MPPLDGYGCKAPMSLRDRSKNSNNEDPAPAAPPMAEGNARLGSASSIADSARDA